MSPFGAESHPISPHLRIVRKNRDTDRDVDQMTWAELEAENSPKEKETIPLEDRLESLRDLLGFYNERVAFLEEQIELPPENRIWAEKSEQNQPSSDLIEREIDHLRNERIPEVTAQIQRLEAELRAPQEPELPRVVNQ